MDRPGGELETPTHRILQIFEDFGVRATFFVLGEVARWYPDLVRSIHHAGHEIACHGLHHVDLQLLERGQLREQLITAKEILETLIGEPVLGYRAPNLIIEPWVMGILEELGFLYDSSVCGSRSFMGKFKGLTGAPVNPYFPARDSLARRGDGPVLEVPIPHLPLLKVPGGTGIMTRIAGLWCARVSLKSALRHGHAVYYFHPYELEPAPMLDGIGLRERVFLRRTGRWYENALRRLLCEHASRTILARDLVTSFYDSHQGGKGDPSHA